MREIEIKIKLDLEDESLLTAWLAKNSKVKKEVRQVEYYLDNIKETFIFDSLGYKD